jgi:uncharacterized protein (DUF1015 family)
LEIRPFTGYRYNPAVVGLIDRVVSPPYDVYDDAMQQAAYDSSPYHFVRLILNRDSDPYASAAATLRQWVEKQVLVKESGPAIYPYVQHYRDPAGKSLSRRGFFALVRLTAFGAGPVHAHERTLPKPLGDRLNLMRATRADLGPIFVVFPDHGGRGLHLIEEATSAAPAAETVDQDGNEHQLWVATDSGWQARLTEMMKSVEGVIADGHHRYSAALRYAEEHRAAGAGPDDSSHFKLVAFFPGSADNLTVFPIHRVVESWPAGADVSKYFDRRLVASNPHEIAELVAATPMSLGTLASDGKAELWSYKPDAPIRWDGKPTDAYKRLPPALFEAAVLRGILGMTPERIAAKEGLQFVKKADEASALAGKKGARAFFLPPTPLDAIFATAQAGELMPQKSTFFYPKLLSGLVSHLHGR